MSRSASANGSLVLDSEGLARAVRRDAAINEWLRAAQLNDTRVVASAATLVEVIHPRIKRPALEWTLSRIVVVDVTETIARTAARILADAELHGHQHAIDAMVCATALSSTPPVTVITSDPSDISALCGDTVAVHPV